MNLATIRSHVRYRVGARGDVATGDGLSAINGWINAANREIAHSTRFHELEGEGTVSTANGVRTVAIPIAAAGNAVYAVLSVYDTTNAALLDPFVGTFQEYERTIGTTTNRPSEWLHFSNAIYLKPTPNAVLVLRAGLWLEPLELVDDTDTPEIPAVWHDGIEILATRNGWRALGDDERALAIERGEWASFLRRVRTPIGIEAHVPKRRGARMRQRIVDHRIGS